MSGVQIPQRSHCGRRRFKTLATERGQAEKVGVSFKDIKKTALWYNSRMVVVFLARLFYPHIGGVEKHILEISKILLKKNYKVVVFTEQHDPKLKCCETIEGISVYRFSVGKNDWFKKFRIWREIWKNRDIIKKADLIHVHDVFFWYLPFRFLYSMKPIFTTFHGYEAKFPPSKKAILVRKISEKLSRGNICVGDYIRKWYGTIPTFITYGGVNVGKSQISNLKSQIHNSKLKILFIGRIEEDTGVLIYLKALELLRQEKIEFEFEACGDGSLRREVERYGKVNGFAEELDNYFKDSDIVFASSYLSIFEAMKHKKLVFAVYNNPLKKDYLKMSPFEKWIVIENSPEKIAEKIKYFVKHQKKKNKIVNRACEWVKTQTWNRVADEYLNLWHSNDAYH